MGGENTPGEVADGRSREFRTSRLEGAMRGGPGALETAIRTVLWPPSLLYSAVVRLRNAAYSMGVLRTKKVACPVISVGNLTAGGTGKTPAVEYVASILKLHGRRPAVLSRGYGAVTASGLNDEAAAMDPGTRVYPSPDRLRGARSAMADGADCLVLDDGCQHRRIHRDLEILLVDALEPFGGGRLLPSGFLREPLSSAGRADLIVLTRSDQVGEGRLEEVERVLAPPGGGVPVLHAVHEPVALAGDREEAVCGLQGTRAFVFSGLGNPRGFEGTVRSLGIEVVGGRRFPDHHEYREGEIRSLSEEAKASGAGLLLTTSKDWVKVSEFPRFGMDMGFLKVRFRIVKGEDRFREIIAGVLGTTGATGAEGGPKSPEVESKA